MSREIFLKHLTELKQQIVEMAALTETSLKSAVTVFQTMDKDVALELFEGDDQVDDLESEIESKCISLTATQQPAAKDLRLITAVLKMITDIERIADHAADIGEIILEMHSKGMKDLVFPDPEMFQSMADTAICMFDNTIQAYIHDDVVLARHVCEEDNVLDSFYNELVDTIIEHVETKPSTARQFAAWLNVVKYIERIGDHATNIAEWVIYNVTGEHQHYN